MITFFPSISYLQERHSENNDQKTSLEPKYQGWTTTYNDPVELAKEVMNRTKGFWTPIGYTLTVGVYKIGAPVAMYGGGYILMESPNLAVDLASGGFYKVGSSVGYDFILDVIESSVKTPRKVCKNISQTVIQDGLEDYWVAYGIAKNYRDTKSLSREDAQIFLDHRWGLLKLAIARKLYNESNKKEITIDQSLAQKSVKELLDRFDEGYQKDLGVNKKLPIVKAALFIKDVRDILEAKKVGMMDYPPYLDFTNNMDALNKLRLEEARKYSSFSPNKPLFQLGQELNKTGTPINIKKVHKRWGSRGDMNYIDLSYPQIDGLADTIIQNNLNKDIKEAFMQGLPKNPLKTIAEGKELGYYLEISYEVTVNKNDILCFKHTLVEYSGGAHGNGGIIDIYIINLKTGKMYSETELFNDGYKGKLIPIVKNALKEEYKDENLDQQFTSVDDYPNRFFYLNEKNLVIHFGQYTYRGNPETEVHIPYAVINELINPQGPIAILLRRTKITSQSVNTKVIKEVAKRAAQAFLQAKREQNLNMSFDAKTPPFEVCFWEDWAIARWPADQNSGDAEAYLYQWENGKWKQIEMSTEGFYWVEEVKRFIPNLTVEGIKKLNLINRDK